MAQQPYHNIEDEEKVVEEMYAGNAVDYKALARTFAEVASEIQYTNWLIDNDPRRIGIPVGTFNRLMAALKNAKLLKLIS